MLDTKSAIPNNVVIHVGASVENSKFEGFNFIGKYSTVAYCQFGKYSYISQFSIIKSTTVGNFTSISWGCSIGPEEHDFNRLTSHSILTSNKAFTLFDQKLYNPFEKELTIGNDVWIGCNSTILRGLRIGDGAIIGANSLVTKDVPPFAIVVGSPAKILKYRFDDKIICALQEIKWWDLSDEIIKKLFPIFQHEKLDIKIIEDLKNIIGNEK